MQTVEEAVDRCKEAQEKKIMLWGKDIRADMRWQQHLELERLPFQPESIQETGH